MTTEKKIKAIECINSNRYKISDNGIMCYRAGVWRNMSPSILPNGYKQLTISNHKRQDTRISIRIYEHVFMYMLTHGIYDDGLIIDHIDGNPSNNHIDNLRAITQAVNVNPIKTRKTKGVNELRPIRMAEITEIRRLMNEGYSQSMIAKILDLNRLSVRYTINNIKNGKTLKYEH